MLSNFNTYIKNKRPRKSAYLKAKGFQVKRKKMCLIYCSIWNEWVYFQQKRRKFVLLLTKRSKPIRAENCMRAQVGEHLDCMRFWKENTKETGVGWRDGWR